MGSLSAASIFPVLGLDRRQVRWEEHLQALTPVEARGRLLFKREDYFAPLGYGGINGSKLRQCIWLVNRYVAAGGRAGVLSGASVQSPQLCMGSAVAAHYGLQSLHVIGGSRPSTAARHESVALASYFGARFVIEPVGYNPALQRRVGLLRGLSGSLSDYMVLEYGITLGLDKHAPEAVEAFHRLGAAQVANLPEDVETIVIPTGSANSAVSILYGVALAPPPRLRAVYLIGIGPNRLVEIDRRLAAIERVTGRACRLYRPRYVHTPLLQQPAAPGAWYDLVHHDLHSTGYCTYQDKAPWSYEGIDFHPTYEGKVMKYLHERLPDLLRPSTLVWIVGSAPSRRAMQPVLDIPEGEMPLTVEAYG